MSMLYSKPNLNAVALMPAILLVTKTIWKTFSCKVGKNSQRDLVISKELLSFTFKEEIHWETSAIFIQV